MPTSQDQYQWCTWNDEFRQTGSTKIIAVAATSTQRPIVARGRVGAFEEARGVVLAGARRELDHCAIA